MITINDPMETLTPANVAALQAKAAAYPFDLHVMIESDVSAKALFEGKVASMVHGSKQLAIGVDPRHHFTFVRGSADLGLPNGPEVAAAGNAWFKRGDLVTGIDSIAARANDLRSSSQLVSSQTGAPIVVHTHTTSAGVWWLLGGVAFAVLCTAAWVLIRNRRREQRARELEQELETERLELQTRNVEEQSWHDKMASRQVGEKMMRTLSAMPLENYRPSSQPPAYVPAVQQIVPSSPPAVIVNNDRGAADMLLAYELGRHDNPRIVERETVIERDSGSSASNWSSSSDSSSSSDWGSSSDSSSSSDWGGGSDSGSSGGGSDW